MRKLSISNYKIQTSKVNKDLRLVLLSDLHGCEYGEENEILLSKVREIHPDAVLIAGDMVTAEDVTGAEDLEPMRQFVAKLGDSYPVFYSNGNHEYFIKCEKENYGDIYDRYRENLQSHGVTFLENSHADTEIAGVPVSVWGLEIPGRFYRRFSWEKLPLEEMEGLIGKAQDDKFRILLAHNPMLFPTYAGWGADLTVAGHLHGGFMRFPLVGGIISPQMRPFPKYDKGLFEKNGRYLAVGAGLGSHRIDLRFGNPPEIVVIDVEKES